jgi:uncharacterized membrane protein YqjE
MKNKIDELVKKIPIISLFLIILTVYWDKNQKSDVSTILVLSLTLISLAAFIYKFVKIDKQLQNKLNKSNIILIVFLVISLIICFFVGIK